MQKLEIIIRPDMLEKLKEILNRHNAGGMTVMSVMGCGNQKGDINEYKGMRLNMNLIPKIMAIVVVKDEIVDDILVEIQEKLSSGKVGDGKVFVCEVREAMRIRTGERGTSAV
ncbi:MAG TPA: transcriptional regulator [Ruminococcaceae bacterium]|jgi:nitrogen regulatory protein P-II 1|nr:transcriptional regulator [Oscillospiraceae bacterium]